MASSCHVSVKPKNSIEKKVRRLKMRKDLLLSDQVFNKVRFNVLLDFESRIKNGFVNLF